MHIYCCRTYCTSTYTFMFTVMAGWHETIPEDNGQNIVHYKFYLEVSVTVWTTTPYHILNNTMASLMFHSSHSNPLMFIITIYLPNGNIISSVAAKGLTCLHYRLSLQSTSSTFSPFHSRSHMPPLPSLTVVHQQYVESILQQVSHASTTVSHCSPLVVR